MRLNPDCVRDVLLAIEAAELGEYISPGTLHRSLTQYSESEIDYTCLLLDDGGFLISMKIQLPQQEIPNVKSIVRLTYQGHEFIAKIRDAERWHGVKRALPAIRNYSLHAINAVAEGMTSAAISAFLQANL